MRRRLARNLALGLIGWLAVANAAIPEGCATELQKCKFWGVCQDGCPADLYLITCAGENYVIEIQLAGTCCSCTLQE